MYYIYIILSYLNAYVKYKVTCAFPGAVPATYLICTVSPIAKVRGNDEITPRAPVRTIFDVDILFLYILSVVVLFPPAVSHDKETPFKATGATKQLPTSLGTLETIAR